MVDTVLGIRSCGAWTHAAEKRHRCQMADRLLKQGLSSAAEKATLLPAAFRIPSCLLLAVEMSEYTAHVVVAVPAASLLHYCGVGWRLDWTLTDPIS